MALIDSIRNDIQRFTTSTRSPGVVPITITTAASYIPDAVSVVCNGTAIKHSIAINPETGATIRGKTARITFSEAALIALAYPVRNANNKVQLKDNTVSFVDSAGLTYNGIISEIFPDETTGLIVCELKDFS